MKDLTLGFAGTPDFAGTQLSALLDAGYTPKLILTQPDRPVGRGKRLQPSPVKRIAEAAGLNVATPPSLKRPEQRTVIDEANLDVLVVAAYGLILPAEVLTAPRYGCINVHASLLPRWRGAAPVERAIMAGDRETGVCIMQMDEGLDTGDVLTRGRIAITPEMTGGALEARLAELGARLLLEVLPQLGALTPEPQEGEPTYAHKLTGEDAVIDWARPALDVALQVRALAERRTAWSALGDLRVRVLEAEPLSASSDAAPPGSIREASATGIDVQCGDGLLRLKRVALNRGKGTVMDAAAVLNGYGDAFAPGSVFG